MKLQQRSATAAKRRARKIREKKDFVTRTTEARRRQELSTSPSRGDFEAGSPLNGMNTGEPSYAGLSGLAWEMLSTPPLREEVFAVSIILSRKETWRRQRQKRKKRSNIVVCSKWIPSRKRRSSNDVEILCEEFPVDLLADRKMWFRNDTVHYCGIYP